ncbi:flagellar motor protein MotA [Rhodospirillaceae bacterium SYSU D60014]|uniref:flagellar motor protein MotA n=1 Tax=Virgifigura deserti TaxID=2268457 RepID=UPI000E6720B0
MTRPKRYLVLMAVCVAAVLLLSAILYPQLHSAFMNNPALNGGILIVALIGIVYLFWQVLRLYPEVTWLESVMRGERMLSSDTAPRLLAPMAAMIGERKGRLSLSAMSLRSLLDGINARLSESHDISRYLIGLLVFLGLLGTFWGLLGTISAVGEAVSRISVGAGDANLLFSELKEGLQAPLSGMGTAFSSSMFGLAGALVLGFLELQAGQAHNRFFNELEDWLAGQTRLSGGGPVGDGEQPVPAYIQALLEQTADSLENLQRTMTRGEEGRIQANNNLKTLTDRLGMLTDQMRAEQQLMVKLAENQTEIRPMIARLADLASQGGFGIDEASRHHIRNVDLQMNRLIEELSLGRQYTVQELRSEIKLLARTIAAIAEEGER